MQTNRTGVTYEEWVERVNAHISGDLSSADHVAHLGWLCESAWESGIDPRAFAEDVSADVNDDGSFDVEVAEAAE